ncbi:MAG TPA: ABC transporter substrate-binding protein [Casimicrobiaceae bacterium]|nr:ABC transporter substrate-binding protein [Casimicrobiaceae bacterium]
MDRRTFVVALSAGLIAVPTRAEVRRSARVGWVGGWYSPSAAATLLDAFRQGMREHGYVEGQNFTIDDRWMKGNSVDEAARLTVQLVQSKVDIFVALGQAVPGVKAAAGSLSVVFGFSGDPVAAKLVASLARPGGNLTGFTLLAPDLAGKRVELLKQAAPRVLRLAALTNPLHPGEEQELRETQIAASRLGLTLQPFPVHTVGEVSAALEGMHTDHIDGVIALSNLLIMRERSAIAEFAAKYRIPTISGWQDFAVDGNLMSYGPNIEDAWRDVAATYVDKILQGTKPADLAVQQPTEFQLVINQRTAKALGLSIAPSLLIQANRVID